VIDIQQVGYHEEKRKSKCFEKFKALLRFWPALCGGNITCNNRVPYNKIFDKVFTSLFLLCEK